MAHMHKMLKTYNNHISVSLIKNMSYNYVYNEQTSYLMEFKCNFTLSQSTLSNLCHSNSYDFWICKG